MKKWSARTLLRPELDAGRVCATLPAFHGVIALKGVCMTLAQLDTRVGKYIADYILEVVTKKPAPLFRSNPVMVSRVTEQLLVDCIKMYSTDPERLKWKKEFEIPLRDFGLSHDVSSCTSSKTNRAA